MKLLLDEMMDAAITEALCREHPGVDIQRVARWQGGRLSALDPELLRLLWEEHRTLVTRDVNTMPQHLAQRMRHGLHHAGVVFVGRAFAQDSPRAVIRALAALIREQGDGDWTDRTHGL